MISNSDISKVIVGLKGQINEQDTSLIVSHLPLLEERLQHLTQRFPNETLHAIAIKTNPHPQMLKHLVGLGYGLEAASIEEVNMAIAAGCAPSKIVFDSPVKTRSEIDCVAGLTDMLVNVNSVGELSRFPSDAACTIGIRVNPQVHTGAPEMFDVSRNESKFGVAISSKQEIVDAALAHPVNALHMHSGSQMKDLQVQRGALEALKALADEINTASPGKIHTLDIGGGLPSEPLSDATRMAEYGAIVAEVFNGSKYQLVTEFGQWVHAEAGFALSRVEYVLDESRIFIHLGADFFMRDAYTKARPFALEVWDEEGHPVEGEKGAFDIAGPLCFAGDYLAHGAALPATTAEGNWLSINGTGANTYALWSRHCSRTVPKCIAFDGVNTSIWSERTTINY